MVDVRRIDLDKKNVNYSCTTTDLIIKNLCLCNIVCNLFIYTVLVAQDIR